MERIYLKDISVSLFAFSNYSLSICKPVTEVVLPRCAEAYSIVFPSCVESHRGNGEKSAYSPNRSEKQ